MNEHQRPALTDAGRVPELSCGMVRFYEWQCAQLPPEQPAQPPPEDVAVSVTPLFPMAQHLETVREVFSPPQLLHLIGASACENGRTASNF